MSVLRERELQLEIPAARKATDALIAPAGPAVRSVRRSSIRGFVAAAVLLDLLVITMACLTAVALRAHLSWLLTPSDVHESVAGAAPAMILGWMAILWLSGSYQADEFGAGSEEFRRVFNASLIAAAVVSAGCYLTKHDLSRGFFVLLFMVGIPGLVTGRVVLRRELKRARARGAFRSRVLLVGGVSYVDEIAATLRRESWLGYDIAGALISDFGRRASDPNVTPLGLPIVGDATPDNLLHGVEDIEAVIFTGGRSLSAAERQQVLRELGEGVKVMIAPALADLSSDRFRARAIGGLPLMHIDPPTGDRALQLSKRLFDIVGSLTLIVLGSPLMLAAALWIKLHDHGPVFFRHERVGHRDGTFDCLKFRTMVVDAESQVHQLQQELDVSALLFKVKEDPRITRPGRFLRRYSIDELPQLFNVLRGDMSLVGPRPQTQQEVECYDAVMKHRLHVRPGITGLWQVSGRNDLSVQDSVRLDLYYVDNWSMLQDLNILAKTLGAVFSARGAY